MGVAATATLLSGIIVAVTSSAATAAPGIPRWRHCREQRHRVRAAGRLRHSDIHLYSGRSDRRSFEQHHLCLRRDL